ncbi:MAG TPA: sodium-independent anion transporter, partial [Nitrospiraceae bacterium]|nr:sodium-independent anion transporter [Nitrospiraceae bacterium]
ALAFTVIAGLPVQVGLYSAFVPMVVYSLLGTSQKLSVSTTSAIAILTAAELSRVVHGGSPGELMTAAATLAFLVGVFLCLAAVLRLGFLAYFISTPVLTGFKAGLGLVIIVDQLPKILGVHIDKIGIFRDIVSVFHHLPETHVPTVLVGGAGLLMIVILEKVRPHSPAPLFAVAAGIALSYLLGLKSMGVHIVGDITAGLPTLSIPDVSLFVKLWPGALGIALMSFTESIAAGRAFAGQGDPKPAVNRELFALGAAGLLGGLFQAMPAGGGTSQTAVNSSAGARTQAAELVTAACTLIVMVFLSGVIARMPLCVLAAVVIVTTVPLLNPADFKAIYHVRRNEFYWSLVAFAGVMVLGTLDGILVAVAISVLMLMYHANHPPVYLLGRKKGTDIYRNLEVHPQDEEIPGMLIVRTEGMLTFASMPRAADTFNALIEGQEAKVLLLDLSAVPDIEYTALMQLEEAERNMADKGRSLRVAGLNRRVFESIQRTSLGERLKDDRMFDTVEEAVQQHMKKRD